MSDGALILEIDGTNLTISPGDIIKLNRFDVISWRALHGWYAWGGNRPTCGWYLQQVDSPGVVKPLLRTDLDDVYFVEKSSYNG